MHTCTMFTQNGNIFRAHGQLDQKAIGEHTQKMVNLCLSVFNLRKLTITYFVFVSKKLFSAIFSKNGSTNPIIFFWTFLNCVYYFQKNKNRFVQHGKTHLEKICRYILNQVMCCTVKSSSQKYFQKQQYHCMSGTHSD